MFSGGYLLSCEGHDFNTKVFQRLLNSLEPFSGKKLNLNCATAGATGANFKTSACLFTFYWRKYFFSDNIFVSKVQNHQGVKCRSTGSWPENQKF